MSEISNSPPRSVLIVRLSAIGDVVHALPVLDALRTCLPDARLGWVVEELSAPLLEDHPQLDKLYVIPKKRWKANFRGLFSSEIRPFFRLMKADGWDAAVDLQGLSKSGLVAWASGARVRVGYGDKDGREVNKLFTNAKVTPLASERHVVQRNLALLRGLGLKVPEDATGMLGLTGGEKSGMRGRLIQEGWNGVDPLLALNPGAGWVSKQWPASKFAEAGRTLHNREGLLPLILWGPKEEPLRDQIASFLNETETPFVVAPATRVREMATLISVCSAYIGGDTGATHLAGMLGVRTLAVFGASDGYRNRPWPLQRAALVQRMDLDCVPCWKTHCPLADDDHMACLRKLDAHDAVKLLPSVQA